MGVTIDGVGADGGQGESSEYRVCFVLSGIQQEAKESMSFSMRSYMCLLALCH